MVWLWSKNKLFWWIIKLKKQIQHNSLFKIRCFVLNKSVVVGRLNQSDKMKRIVKNLLIDNLLLKWVLNNYSYCKDKTIKHLEINKIVSRLKFFSQNTFFLNPKVWSAAKEQEIKLVLSKILNKTKKHSNLLL